MEIKFASDPEKLKAVKYYKFLFEFMGTIDIDLATGELGPDIVRNQRNLAAGKLKAGSHGSDVSHYFDTLGRITDYTHSYSPYSNFDTSLAALSGTGGEYYSKSLDSTYPKVIHPEKLQRSLGHLDPMVLRVALKTFAEGYVASHPGGLEPLASRTDSGAKLEAYCQAVTEKRKAIIGAVAELTK